MSKIGYKLRNFPLEIHGQENVLKDGCLIVCNHSNTHDSFIIMAEVLKSIGVPSTFMVGIEGLSPFELWLFKSARATMINRKNKQSANAGLYDITGKVIHGDTCVIFGEGTWNLHPYKPMQNIKVGSVKAAAIAGKPIVPVIMEYVEVPGFCSKEKDLYSKCVVKFGKPMLIDRMKSLIEQNDRLQAALERMRTEIRKENGTYRSSIEDVDPYVYVNHTWLKKYGSPLFEADMDQENKFLYYKPGAAIDNEWHFTKEGVFEPGTTQKQDEKYVRECG